MALYEIKFICTSCKKATPATKDDYRDIALPAGWGVLDGSSESPYSSSMSTSILPALYCGDCLPAACADLVSGTDTTRKLCLRIERFVR